MNYLRCVLASVLLALPSGAEEVAVFLAAGQSNANPQWAAGIRQVLQQSGRYPRLEVVNAMHVGSALFRWFDGGQAAPFYDADLAAVRKVMDGIRAAGDTPVFQGLFWMQGEGDSKADDLVALYSWRFNGMLEQYCTDLNLAEARFAIGITDSNPNPPWDDPAMLLTTRELVEALRVQQIQIGGQTNGVAVDSRGLARVDAVHLPWPESALLGRQMAAAWLQKFPERPEVVATAEEETAAATSFRKLDRNRDCGVSRAEFFAPMKPRQKIFALRKRLGPEAKATVEKACGVVFNWFDTDQTGRLDPEEWLAGCAYDPAVSAPAFHRLHEALTDRNRDGQHSYKEFVWILRGPIPIERCAEWYDGL